MQQHPFSLVDQLTEDLQAISLEPRPEVLRQMVESWRQSLDRTLLQRPESQRIDERFQLFRPRLDSPRSLDTAQTSDAPAIPDNDSSPAAQGR